MPETSAYRHQRDLVDDLLAQWVGHGDFGHTEKLHETPGKSVRGVVERFDQSRGFGFVEIATLKDTAFLHASVIEKAGLEDICEGDAIICDLSRNEKGIFVSQITEIIRVDRPLLIGQVAKIFEERGYGFVYIPQTGADAFFHFHLLSPKQKKDLFEGQELLVEVTTDTQGRAQVRRVADQYTSPIEMVSMPIVPDK